MWFFFECDELLCYVFGGVVLFGDEGDFVVDGL